MSQPSKILMVDDDRAVCDSMVDILQLEGYDVDVANSGEEAVACYRRERHDMVLLDIHMPDMNGLETLRALKAIDASARVIMITGHEVGALASGAMQEGAEAIFRKPLDIAAFLPVLLMPRC